MDKKSFEPDTFRPVVNILNEVCNGLYITNFTDKIGASEDFARSLLHKYSDQYKKNEQIQISNDLEFKVILNSFKEVFKNIDDWEFDARVGITLKDAQDLLNKIKSR